jgi:glycosyltransferase involved in cell wall biosynthesis
MRRGGRERQLALVLANEDRKRTESTIICLNRDFQGNDYIGEYDLANRVRYNKCSGKLARLLEIRSMLASDRPDIVWTWGVSETLYAFTATRGLPTRMADGAIQGNRIQTPQHTWVHRLMQTLRIPVIGNSQAGLDSFGIRRGFLLRNGIESKFAQRMESSQRDEMRRAQYGIGPETVLLFTCANLLPIKDYPTALRAVGNVVAAGLPLHYAIAGEGTERPKLEALIRELHLENHVHLLGRQMQTEPFYALSDIYLQSSLSEGLSNSIIEALFQGLPIIASITGGNPELATPTNGLLFACGDVPALTRHLTALVENVELRKQMGRESAKNSQLYTIPTMIARYGDIAEAIMKGKTGDII